MLRMMARVSVKVQEFYLLLTVYLCSVCAIKRTRKTEMAKRGTQSNGMNKAQRQGGPGINNSGSRLWERAKQIIPGGNMLLSKRPEMFAPDCWPTYFSQASGCVVWDQTKINLDMSRMGIGTNILGYGDPEVDAAVMRTAKPEI